MDDIENRLTGTRDALLAKRARLHETLAGVRGQIVEVDRQLADCAAAARIFRLNWPVEQPTIGPEMTVKDAVVGCLKAAGTEGATVSAMRPIIERELGKTFHPKSIGVALYRLKASGQTVRRGRHWWLSELDGPEHHALRQTQEYRASLKTAERTGT